MKKLIVLMFCSLAFTTNLYADNSAQRLQSILASIQTLQGNFTQTIYNSQGKVMRVTHGLMIMQKPNFFRWVVTSPFQQQIVADGKNLWVYDVDLQQVKAKRLSRDGGGTPAMLLNGSAKSLSRMFTISSTGNEYLLKARFRNNPFTLIKLKFNGNHLTTMHMADYLGQQSVLVFSNMQVNHSIPKSTFRFVAPRNVDVVKMR